MRVSRMIGYLGAAAALSGFIACAGSKAEGTNMSGNMSADGGMMMSADGGMSMSMGDGGMSMNGMGGAMRGAEGDLSNAAGQAGRDLKSGASSAANDLKGSASSMAADAGAQAMNSASSTATTAADSAKSKASSMAESAGSAAGSAADSAKGAAGSAADSAKAAPTDAQIVAIAMAANQAELDAAKYAAAHAKSAKVKSAAKMMIKDHTKVGKDAKALVAKSGLSPEEGDASKAQADAGAKELENLKTLKGAELDKAYVDAEVQNHDALGKAIDDTLIPSAKNEDLKAMLTKLRPVVAKHAEHLKALQTSLAAAPAAAK